MRSALLLSFSFSFLVFSAATTACGNSAGDAPSGASEDGGADASREGGHASCTPPGMICCGGDYGGPAECGPNNEPVCTTGRLAPESECYQPCDPHNASPPAVCGDASAADAGDAAAGDAARE
jgi:hypothetical protein